MSGFETNGVKMSNKYKPIDLSKLKTHSIHDRKNRSNIHQTPLLTGKNATAEELIFSFPNYLGASAFKNVVKAICVAHQNDKPVIVAFGAHVLKVGCGPILIDLIQRGIIKGLVCNGACAIHDVELALFGETSEDVAETIQNGSFGMIKETFDFFNKAVKEADWGLGFSIGNLLIQHKASYRHRSVFAESVFAESVFAGIPICVQVAIGTDTIHVSPDMDGGALGDASMYDFRVVCDMVSDLGSKEGSDIGGVWLNIGSAVILPEVFLKAVSVARNLGVNLDNMVTANFDMIQHYRPHQNVVTRPVKKGNGYEITGHHEIMLPLLRQAIIDNIGEKSL